MSLRNFARKAINNVLRVAGLEVRARMAPPANEETANEVPATEIYEAPQPEPELDLRPYRWLIDMKVKTVLDIGANTGQFAELIHKIIPNAGIISFEPLEDCYQELLINGRKLGDFKAYNFALGTSEGKVPIYRSEFSPSSSLLPMADLHKEAFPFTKRGSVETINVKKLDDLNLHIFYPLLVKIDVQGFEDKVISGGQKTIEKADVLIVEVSFQTLYDGQPMFDRIYMQLKKLGFSYRGNWYQNDDVRNGSALQADAIFIKIPGNIKRHEEKVTEFSQ